MGSSRLLLALILAALSPVASFIIANGHTDCRDSKALIVCRSGVDNDDNAKSTIRIDDGGSDLTDRFKYKVRAMHGYSQTITELRSTQVNALMGAFDPQTGDDTERGSGNILNAMLKFPVRYTFNVVGKTATTGSDPFVAAAKTIVQSGSGDDSIVCKVTPRGTKFTKVSIEAQVDSANIISTIYNDLEAMEHSVMQF